MNWSNNTLTHAGHTFRLNLDEQGLWGFTVEGLSNADCWGIGTKAQAMKRAEALARRMAKNESFIYSL